MASVHADHFAGRGLLRERHAHGHAKVTNIELFFDLVFVFAVTQLSHMLLGQLNLHGALQTLLLFLAVWWVWHYTAWVTNWLDPERTAVRIMLFALMLIGLVLSASLPHAFEAEAPLFAICYVTMQIGRTLFMLWAVGPQQPVLTRNFQRIALWLLVSAVFWIAGSVVSGESRLWVWAAAIAIDYGSVAIGFRVPGLGKSETTDWNIAGGHMAERCSLFIMIALGESLLVTGSTAAGVPATRPTISAFGAAFVGCVAMWWIYFNVGVERGAQQIATAADPGRIARIAYTYIHLLIVAGIVVSAVSDELVLAHPSGHVDAHLAWPMVGGAALFLFGNLWFKAVIWGRVPLSHAAGLVLFAVVAWFASAMTPLWLACAVSAVLVTVAIWETASLRSERRAPAGH